jgi:hypothetical protein
LVNLLAVPDNDQIDNRIPNIVLPGLEEIAIGIWASGVEIAPSWPVGGTTLAVLSAPQVSYWEPEKFFQEEGN